MTSALSSHDQRWYIVKHANDNHWDHKKVKAHIARQKFVRDASHARTVLSRNQEKINPEKEKKRSKKNKWKE
jgi:hypothetical protein